MVVEVQQRSWDYQHAGKEVSRSDFSHILWLARTEVKYEGPPTTKLETEPVEVSQSVRDETSFPDENT